MDRRFDRESFRFFLFHRQACVFGQVTNEEMIVSTYGQIAERQWHWLAEQYPYLVLHTFVVMPNHVHGILEIDWAEIAPETKVKSISELMGAYKLQHPSRSGWLASQTLHGSVLFTITSSGIKEPI